MEPGKVKPGKEGIRIWHLIPLAKEEQLIHWNHGKLKGREKPCWFFIFKDKINNKTSTTPRHSNGSPSFEWSCAGVCNAYPGGCIASVGGRPDVGKH